MISEAGATPWEGIGPNKVDSTVGRGDHAEITNRIPGTEDWKGYQSDIERFTQDVRHVRFDDIAVA
jgi:hypothetical protein